MNGISFLTHYKSIYLVIYTRLFMIKVYALRGHISSSFDLIQFYIIVLLLLFLKNVRNILIDDIQTGVKQWQKEHFHKSSLPPQTLKETKQFEQDFELAQKQWSKRLKKVHTTKKEYYQACKTERSLQVQVRNAKSDPSGTAEQVMYLFLQVNYMVFKCV